MLSTKPQVFISSTIADLPSERKAALIALEKAGCAAVMSEFTIEAVPVNSLDACLSKVAQANIYILILGGRYGWRPSGVESITELEYQTAQRRGIPILVFNTTYSKEADQKAFEQRVESHFFRKTVSDAFELEAEIRKALESELSKLEQSHHKHVDSVYSNLVPIVIPKHVYLSELQLNRTELRILAKEHGFRLTRKSTAMDYAIVFMKINEIKFPHDWIVDGSTIVTFRDTTESTMPLRRFCGPGERHEAIDYYSQSTDKLSNFKFLLRMSLSTKLFRLGIKWIKDEKLYAFVPVDKDNDEQWKSRSIQWANQKTATRKVVDIKYNLKRPTEVFNLKCLAFRVDFHFLEQQWYLSIKPDWAFLWPDLKPSSFGTKNIKWLKLNEWNSHVFNHFNFILRYIQPKTTGVLFPEYEDYKYMQVGNIERSFFSPTVPDDIWLNLENQKRKKRFVDKSGDIPLFEA